MKELRRYSLIIHQKSVLTCRKAELVFFIAAESSSLRIAGSRTRTGSLWFPSASS